MAQLSRSVGIILVLIIGFVVQLIFSMVDVRDTPNKAVVEFSKAYFELDKSMTKTKRAKKAGKTGTGVREPLPLVC